MGIRFHCPNGHKLNVKAFLAGKKGICPHCGAKFRIPKDSEAGLAKKSRSAAPALDLADNNADANPNSGGTATLAPAAAAAASAPAESRDPISEAPHAVWYVRPPSGGQYGPASGDILRNWITEGRVSSETLVWREGWAEWQPAGPMFHGLNQSGMNSLPPTGPVATVGSPTYSRLKKGNSKRTSMIVIGSLFVAAVVLLAGLVYVLSTMGR